MTLNSSGPISLGGSTTGESINLELGQSATTQVSLNDSNVRSLAGVSSGAIVMPIDFWGKSSAVYYAAQLVPTCAISPTGMPFRINSDKSVTWFAVYNNTYIYAITFNSSGVLSTQKVTPSYSSAIGQTVSAAIDSSNNIYFIQEEPNICGYDSYVFIQKVDTSYTVTQTRFTLQAWSYCCAPVNNLMVNGATLDSSGNYYFNITTNGAPLPGTGYTTNGSLRALVIKTNSSLVGQNFFNVYGGTLYGTSSYMAANSTSTTGRVLTRRFDFIYSCCSSYSSASVVAWDKGWYLYFYRNNFQTPAFTSVDSSGNVYVFVDDYYAGCMYLYKFDTNGSYVWGRQIYIGSGINNINGMEFDSSGNLYIMFRDYDWFATYILKYNSSGTLQWSRYITYYNCCVSSYNIMQGQNIQISSNDTNAFYVTVKNAYSSPYDTVLLRLPLDGSLTGTINTGYQTMNYGNASVTDAAATAISSSSITYSPTTYTVTTTSVSNSFSTTSTFTGAVVVL